MDAVTLGAAAAATKKQLSARIFSVKDYGAKGDGVADDAAAIAACFAAAAAKTVGTKKSAADGTTSVPVHPTVFFPAGTYQVATGFRKPQGVNVIVDPGAIIRATAAMTAIMYSDPADLLQDEVIEGGTWDCNSLANTGIKLGYYAAMSVRNLTVANALTIGLDCGDATSPHTSYEMKIDNVHIRRRKGLSVPTGSIGLHVFSGDGEINKVVVVSYDIGIFNEGDSNKFIQCHVWGYPAAFSSICFKDAGGATMWIACYADTPTLYGWDISNLYCRIIAPHCYMNESGPDNVATAIFLENSADYAQFSEIVILGKTSANRWLRDIGGDTYSSNWIGLKAINVANMAPNSQTSYMVGQQGHVFQQPTGAFSANDYLAGRAPGGGTTWRLRNSGELDLSAGGGLMLPATTTTTSLTLTTAHSVVYANSASALTITMPSLAGSFGRQYTIKNRGSATVTIAAAGADLIEGAATSPLAAGAVVRLHNDGGQWRLL